MTNLCLLAVHFNQKAEAGGRNNVGNPEKRHKNKSIATHAHSNMHGSACACTHIHVHTPRDKEKVNSQNLQVTEGSESSIFNAADLIVVQLPAGRKEGRERMKACLVTTLPWSTMSSASLSPRCPSTPLQSLLVTG